MSIILGVYPVIQILILSSLMVMQINLPLHVITMSLSCVAYFVVAFKKPGYFEGEQKEAPSIEDEIRMQNQVPIDEKIIKEMDEQSEANDNCEQNQEDEIKQDCLQDQILESIVQKKLEAQKTFKKRSFDEKIEQKIIQENPPDFQQQQIKKIAQLNSDQIEIVHKKLTAKQSHRYCRICKVFQPSRVRHCHECQRCICTFDHHCPWMNNCIGEKNRNIFWVYLLFQFIEFLLVLIDLGRKAMDVTFNKARVYFFTVSVLIATTAAFLLLVFHTYLMLKNLTTWEYVRWDRINYLSIYSYKKSSPFSYGFLRNVTDYFLSGKDPKDWTVNPLFLKLNMDYEKKLNEGKTLQTNAQIPKFRSKMIEKTQTQRAIITRTQP